MRLSSKFEEAYNVRASARMSCFLASWGADTPFANLVDGASLVKNIEAAVSIHNALYQAYDSYFLPIT